MTQDLSLSTDDIGELIDQLGSRQPAVRERADLALKTLTPEQVDRLVRILRAEPKRTMGRMVAWFSVAVWPMVFLPSWLTFGQGGGMAPVFRCLLFGTFLAGYMVLFPLLVARPRFQGTLVYCSTQVTNSRLLGPLITYTLYPTPTAATGVRGGLIKLFGGRFVKAAEIEQALLRVLRKIKPGDEIDLTGPERAGVTKRLLSSNPEIVIALLGLLEQIGGGSDLRNMRALERGAHSGQTSPAVREAAAHCRATIEARIVQQKIPETLLRASQSSSPTKELVRATLMAGPVEEQVLLRTSQVEEPL
jgi:hypothetical protein